MPSPPSRRVAGLPAAQPSLPDEILEEIFLRLEEAADLARASASCTSFRRIVSDRRFLRRFRSLHPPPVLGLLDLDCRRRSSRLTTIGFYSAEPPHRSAPAARAFAQAADFTFSFLPMDSNPNRWCVRDTRDGRVLLSRPAAAAAASFVFDDLVVCDPLHRRYIRIPSIPGDLVASTEYGGGLPILEPFLAPAGEEEESSFRVICNTVFRTNIASLMFSSVTGKWRGITSFSIASYEWMNSLSILQRHCACRCVGWTAYNHEVMLVLDIHLMKFSIVNLPPESCRRQKAMVEAGEGRFGLLILGDRKLDLYSKYWGDNGDGIEEWQHDMVIPLPHLPDCYWNMRNPAEGCLLLQGIPRDQLKEFLKYARKKPDRHYFVLELKTLLIERLCTLKIESKPGYLYSSFPPPLSPPSILNGLLSRHIGQDSGLLEVTEQCLLAASA